MRQWLLDPAGRIGDVAVFAGITASVIQKVHPRTLLRPLLFRPLGDAHLTEREYSFGTRCCKMRQSIPERIRDKHNILCFRERKEWFARFSLRVVK